MYDELKSRLDQFEEITFFEPTEDDDFDLATDDLDLDLSDAGEDKTVLD